MTIEAHRIERIARYQQYLDALERRDPELILALAAAQLNQIPEDRSLLLEAPSAGLSSASVFPALEPPPIPLPERRPVDSVLFRLTTNDRTRLWLIAFGAVCLLVGLLPPARRRA